MADFFIGGIEKRRDLEAFLTKARVVRKRKPEIAGSHDGHAQPPVQTENLAQVLSQVPDVVADAADAEFAEIGGSFRICAAFR